MLKKSNANLSSRSKDMPEKERITLAMWLVGMPCRDKDCLKNRYETIQFLLKETSVSEKNKEIILATLAPETSEKQKN